MERPGTAASSLTQRHRQVKREKKAECFQGDFLAIGLPKAIGFPLSCLICLSRTCVGHQQLTRWVISLCPTYVCMYNVYIINICFLWDVCIYDVLTGDNIYSTPMRIDEIIRHLKKLAKLWNETHPVAQLDEFRFLKKLAKLCETKLIQLHNSMSFVFEWCLDSELPCFGVLGWSAVEQYNNHHMNIYHQISLKLSLNITHLLPTWGNVYESCPSNWVCTVIFSGQVIQPSHD